MRLLIAVLSAATATGTQEAPAPPPLEQQASEKPASTDNPILAQPKADIDFEGWIGIGLQKQAGTLLMSESFASLSGSRGYTVSVYTPERWAQRLAYDAAVTFMPFSVAKLTEEDQRDVLRIDVEPSLPTQSAIGHVGTGSSVEHVVIRDTGGSEAIQPLTIEIFDAMTQERTDVRALRTATSETTTYRGAWAVFSMADVERIRAMDKKREFFITVVGDGRGEKNFHVKQRHFANFGRE